MQAPTRFKHTSEDVEPGAEVARYVSRAGQDRASRRPSSRQSSAGRGDRRGEAPERRRP